MYIWHGVIYSWKVLLEDKLNNPLALFYGATVYSGDRKSTINCSCNDIWLLIFLIQIFCSLFDSVMVFYCFSWICFEWVMQCPKNLSFDGNHVFILAYIVNIILDWLINKGIITWCFSYWPSYTAGLGPITRSIWKTSRNNTILNTNITNANLSSYKSSCNGGIWVDIQ
jgi:hypothetical protein